MVDRGKYHTNIDKLAELTPYAALFHLIYDIIYTYTRIYEQTLREKNLKKKFLTLCCLTGASEAPSRFFTNDIFFAFKIVLRAFTRAVASHLLVGVLTTLLGVLKIKHINSSGVPTRHLGCI